MCSCDDGQRSIGWLARHTFVALVRFPFVTGGLPKENLSRVLGDFLVHVCVSAASLNIHVHKRPGRSGNVSLFRCGLAWVAGGSASMYWIVGCST